MSIKGDVIDVLDAVTSKRFGEQINLKPLLIMTALEVLGYGICRKQLLNAKPTSSNVPKPKQSYKRQTLDSILIELNMQLGSTNEQKGNRNNI